MKIAKNIGKILFYVLFVFVIIFFICSLFFKNNYIGNYKVAIILSGSMEPTLSVDDLVIVKKTDDYKVGDIISFKSDDETIMHRIIEINDDTLITQGDANNVADNPITKDKVEGVYVGKILFLGNIISFIRTPLGLGLFIALSIFVLALTIFDFDDPKRKKYKIIILVLIYLIILISCIVIGYKSKYKGQVSGNDSVTVASVAIDKSQTLQVDTSDLYPGATKKYRFGVKNSKDNSSEVTMGYSIKVESTNKLPLTYKLKCVDKTSGAGIYESTATAINTNTAVTGGILPYGNYVHTYELTIEWDENDNDVKYANQLEIIKIVIDSNQID